MRQSRLLLQREDELRQAAAAVARELGFVYCAGI